MSEEAFKIGGSRTKMHVEAQGPEVVLVIECDGKVMTSTLPPDTAVMIGNTFIRAGVDVKNFLESVKRVKGVETPHPAISQFPSQDDGFYRRLDRDWNPNPRQG